jgi:hypothetical protein
MSLCGFVEDVVLAHHSGHCDSAAAAPIAVDAEAKGPSSLLWHIGISVS